MESHADLLLHTIAIALGAGILSQVLAERLAVPSIVPMLLAGTLLGVSGLGWVQPESLGDGLEALVGISVAIILFEGGLCIEWHELRSQARVILQLITVGAIVTMLGAALFAHLLLGFDMGIAMLLGALVIVTGPTVIGPLLKRVPILPRVSFILESEGVLIDPVGAIISFVVLEIVLASEVAVGAASISLLERFVVGGLIGAATGIILARALRARWIADRELQVLSVLASAVAAFAIANALSSESGLVATVAAGMVVGNVNFPGRHELKRFKGRITTLVLSLLFVLLAAGIDWSVLSDIGWRGFAWVAALMFVVRPLSVFASTVGTDVTFNEKLFLSWISPRGIVAASVASLFAIYLQNAGAPEAQLVQALVFLTITATVFAQGLTAGFWSRVVGVSADSYGVVIVGAGPAGRLLGRLLRDHGREVAMIDSNERNCRIAQRDGLAALAANATDTDNLARIGIGVADALVALTSNSTLNELVARNARERFDVGRAIVLEFEGEVSGGAEAEAAREIERAFGRAVSDEVPASMRGGQALWQGEVAEGVSGTLGELVTPEALPLISIRAGRAEPCGDRRHPQAGDLLIFHAEPRGEWLTEIRRYVPPRDADGE